MRVKGTPGWVEGGNTVHFILVHSDDQGAEEGDSSLSSPPTVGEKATHHRLHLTPTTPKAVSR